MESAGGRAAGRVSSSLCSVVVHYMWRYVNRSPTSVQCVRSLERRHPPAQQLTHSLAHSLTHPRAALLRDCLLDSHSLTHSLALARARALSRFETHCEVCVLVAEVRCLRLGRPCLLPGCERTQHSLIMLSVTRGDLVVRRPHPPRSPTGSINQKLRLWPRHSQSQW